MVGMISICVYLSWKWKWFKYILYHILNEFKGHMCIYLPLYSSLPI